MVRRGINLRVVFGQSPESGRTVTRLLTDMFSFQKRPGRSKPETIGVREHPCALRQLLIDD